MRSLTEEDSKRITALRFLLIVFVVFIHNNLSADEAISYYHLVFTEPIAITWLKHCLCTVLGGAAVPLFFLFAGYLQFCKDDSYIVVLKKRAKSLLVPYILWTLITTLLYFVGQSFPAFSSFFQNENNIVRNWSIVDWLNLLWVHDEIYPLVFQFWFLRDLIVLIVISPLLQWLARRAPVAVLIVTTLCFLNGLPLGFGTALFFYMAGWYFAEYNVSFFKLADKASWLEYAVLLVFVAVATLALGNSIALHGFGIFISCLFFLKLSAQIIARPRLFACTKWLASYSFFLYAIHAPFLDAMLNKVSMRTIPLHGVGCLVQFVLPCILCIVIGTGIGVLLKKLAPPLFTLLNGSRR